MNYGSRLGLRAEYVASTPYSHFEPVRQTFSGGVLRNNSFGGGGGGRGPGVMHLDAAALCRAGRRVGLGLRLRRRSFLASGSARML